MNMEKRNIDFFLKFRGITNEDLKEILTGVENNLDFLKTNEVNWITLEILINILNIPKKFINYKIKE